jgi:hypothetical protein
VYKVKCIIEGSIERRRARLVVKEITQRPRIDFTETYVPVMKYDSLSPQQMATVLTYWPPEDANHGHL